MNRNREQNVQYLARVYDALNVEWFDGELTRPVITIEGTSRIWCHYTLHDAYSGKEAGKRILNVTRGAVNGAELGDLIVMILHEMVHQLNNEVLNVQDVSSKQMYHNKYFARSCARYGLIAKRTEVYGFSDVQPKEELLSWIERNRSILERVV